MKEIVLSEEIRKRIKPTPQGFCGGFDSDVYTLNGNVMRLHIFSCPVLKSGQQLNVKVKILELDRFFLEDGKTVDEGSDDDTLAEFEGILRNKNGKFFFSEMKPSAPINWSHTPPYPWFRVTFARENDKVINKSDNDTDAENFPVVIGKNDEPQESPEYEIGFLITKDDGTPIGNQRELVTHFYGRYSYQPFIDLFDIHTQLDSVNLLNITNSQMKYASVGRGDDEQMTQAVVSSTTQVYDATIEAYNRKKLNAINNALKAIDKLIKESRNPWFQNIQAVNEYYQKLELYLEHVQQYNQMQNSCFATQSECFEMEHGLLRPMATELNKLEDNIHEYLKVSSHPPMDYIDRINKNIAILNRNKTIDEILHNPAVQIMGLLPGAGVVTGMLKLIQGKYTEGLQEVFGSIITYGSFLKLARVANAYRRSSRATVEMLYSYRYRELVSTITTTKVMDKITGMALKQSGEFLGNLFSTVGSFRSLKGHVDSIAILHRNREYILDMTEKAIKGIKAGQINNTDDYLKFLEDLKNVNAAAEFFAHIRLLRAIVKIDRDVYTLTLEAMDDVQKLLGYKELPGINDFDHSIIENTRTLFQMLNQKRVIIQEVIDKQTGTFPNASSIIDYFNEALVQYDMFGLKRNADVRYQNTREEMLLALDEIAEQWQIEKKRRDNWIKANIHRFVIKDPRWLQLQWAINEKGEAAASLPQSLETRISNFIHKLKGQITFLENLSDESVLSFLEYKVHAVTDKKTNCIYDFNPDSFCSCGKNLVIKYY